MKALTVRQPWASLIVAGIKDVENRSWTAHSQRLGIHAATRYDAPGFERALRIISRYDVGVSVIDLSDGSSHNPDAAARAGFPRGALIGYVTVIECHHANECWGSTGFFDDRGLWAPWFCSTWADSECFHWVLNRPALRTPEPMRGHQGLWEMPAEVVPA